MLHVHGMCQSKLYKKLVRLRSNYRNFQTLLIYAVYYIKKNTSTTIQEFHTSWWRSKFDVKLQVLYIPVYIESVNTCTL